MSQVAPKHKLNWCVYVYLCVHLCAYFGKFDDGFKEAPWDQVLSLHPVNKNVGIQEVPYELLSNKDSTSWCLGGLPVLNNSEKIALQGLKVMVFLSRPYYRCLNMFNSNISCFWKVHMYWNVSAKQQIFFLHRTSFLMSKVTKTQLTLVGTNAAPVASLSLDIWP